MIRPGRAARRGAASKALVLMIGSLVVLAGLLALLAWNPRPTGAGSAEGEAKPLMVYVAASAKKPFELIRAEYEQAYGVPVHAQYGPSQTLLAGLEVSHQGDLYLPADDSYLDFARDKELLAETFPLATMQAVAVVAKGNPLGIQSLADLQREGVRLAQANPEAAAIGQLVKDHLTTTGEWESLAQRTTAFKTTVTDVATDVKLGSVDAGIVWDAVAVQFPDLQAVPLPELAAVRASVPLAVLKTSAQPRQALHFARYVAARDKGLPVLARHGFATVAGDPWSEQPELTLYAGSMLRPAIEETIRAFEEREGVKVTRVYNGCGILVGQMKAGQIPDGYFACDSEFMQQVRDLFPAPQDVSQNELVILVPKGNPRGIRSLRDLGQDDLRVGIGHEKQCAMGWLTQRTLTEGGVREVVMKNVKVQTPTGDMLVNQLRAGSLDAAVAYLSNAAGAGDALDAIRIQGLPCSVATQPLAVAKDSAHPQAMARLTQALTSAESQRQFQAQGFVWSPRRSAPPTPPARAEAPQPSTGGAQQSP